MILRRFPNRRFRGVRSRRGAIAVLTAIVLVGLLSFSALVISLSYIEMARSELQLATDAAARSGVIELTVSQSEASAKASAVSIAARHRVAGRAFSIPNSDIQVGNAAVKKANKYTFVLNQSPLNAVRVNGRKGANSSAGSLEIPLSGILGRSTVDLDRNATAASLDYDIVLVLDRSGSMAWDMSQKRFSYPAALAKRPLLENYFSPPDSTASRWAILSQSVNSFLKILADRKVPARVGLVTFASNYKFGNFSSTQVSVDADISLTHAAVQSAISSIGKKPNIGGSNIASGIQEGAWLLENSKNARQQTGYPVIVLFSDGMFNEGDNPTSIAQQIHRNQGITIHSVTFGAEATARQTMDQIAALAGKGLSFHASNASEMMDGFKQIANSIPVILTH